MMPQNYLPSRESATRSEEGSYVVLWEGHWYDIPPDLVKNLTSAGFTVKARPPEETASAQAASDPAALRPE
jgi:hypothetical protein